MLGIGVAKNRNGYSKAWIDCQYLLTRNIKYFDRRVMQLGGGTGQWRDRTLAAMSDRSPGHTVSDSSEIKNPFVFAHSLTSCKVKFSCRLGRRLKMPSDPSMSVVAGI